ESSGVTPASREFFQTQAEFMKSREVGTRVVEAMNLARNEHFDPRQRRPGRFVTWLSQFGPFERMAPTRRTYTDEESKEAALARYQGNLEILPFRLSHLFEIRLESPDPMLASQISN